MRIPYRRRTDTLAGRDRRERACPTGEGKTRGGGLPEKSPNPVPRQSLGTGFGFASSAHGRGTPGRPPSGMGIGGNEVGGGPNDSPGRTRPEGVDGSVGGSDVGIGSIGPGAATVSGIGIGVGIGPGIAPPGVGGAIARGDGTATGPATGSAQHFPPGHVPGARP